MWRLVAPILVVLVVLVPAVGVAASSLGSLNLRLSDFPVGFALKSQRVWTNAESARLDNTTVANLVHHGRILSEERLFKARYPVNGLFEVDASVAKYRSSAGVMWIYSRNRALVSAFKKGGRPFRAFTAGHIGNAVSAFTDTYDMGSFRYTEDIIFFRQGSYFADMDFAGLSPSFKPGTALHLANVLANRIRRSG